MRRLLRHNFYIAIAFMVATIVLGVVGFHVLEDRSYLDSLYLVVQILSTVGLDKQADLSTQGRVFVIILIVVFLGGFTVAASIFIRQLMLEGGEKLKERLRERKAGKMKNHFICCGYGRLGGHTVKELLHFGCNVLVVETDEELADELTSDGLNVIVGDATEDEVLLKAGIKNATGLLTALADDADNVFVTLTARQLNPSIRIIARANSEKTRRKLIQAGAERLVLPHEMGGRRMAYALMRPLLADFIDKVMGEGGEQRLEQWSVPEGCDEIIGKTVKEAQFRNRYGVSVLGLARQGREVEIAGSADPKLQAGDTLIVIGRPEHLKKLPR